MCVQCGSVGMYVRYVYNVPCTVDEIPIWFLFVFVFLFAVLGFFCAQVFVHMDISDIAWRTGERERDGDGGRGKRGDRLGVGIFIRRY